MTTPPERIDQSDILASDLDVVFCGINPALTAHADGHNFSSPTNRFWTAIHLAGFTDRQLAPAEERRLLEYGCGITAVVTRPTAEARDVSAPEIQRALSSFETKMRVLPTCAGPPGQAGHFGGTRNEQRGLGLQRDTVAGATVWVLPNPSGRNRRFPLAALVEAYAELRAFSR
jgi:TDG/mug DNA glycosylase family protein